MKDIMSSWVFWALLSAAFASLTAIFAKLGVENVNADFATFVRTCVVLVALAGILSFTGQWQPLPSLSGRTGLFLLLSLLLWINHRTNITRLMNGSRFSRAISIARRFFFNVMGLIAPPREVGSFATRTHSRFSTRPMPVTMPFFGFGT